MLKQDWNGFLKDFDKTFKELDDMFSQVSYVLESKTGEFIDDVAEADDGYQLKFLVPGFKKEELDITVESKKVTVKGTSARTNKTVNYVFTAPLNKTMSTEGAKAKLEDGILEVFVLKTKDSTTRKVEIA